MRPLKLRMGGFAAFREDTEVNFEDVELAALVGSTGSGKSTIIDGITFALFGSVARYDDARAVAPVINQLATEARVSLDFEVASERYVAVRVVRRTPNGATTIKARLERGDEILAGQAREMGPAVERLLGLDFDRFTKTVVLPQGRFAQFLHDKASDRQELLRHLLDLGVYTRMGAEARRRAATARDQVDALEPELQSEAPTAERVSELAAAAEAARRAQTELATLTGELAQARDDLRAARADAQHLGPLQQRASKTAEVPDAALSLAGELRSTHHAVESAAAKSADAGAATAEARLQANEGPNSEVCRRLLDDYRLLVELQQEVVGLDREAAEAESAVEEARERAEELRSRLEAAHGAVAAARDAVAAARSSADDGPDRNAIESVRRQRAEMECRAEELGGLVEKRGSAEGAETDARSRQEHAQAVLDVASAALDRVRAVKQAEGLVIQLEEGEPCPVCLQTVIVLPEHDIDKELEAHQKDHSQARTALRESASVLSEATMALAEARAEARTVVDRYEELATQLEDAPDWAELDRLESEADELAVAVRDADDELRAAGKAESDLRQAKETEQIFSAERKAQDASIKATAERDGRRDQRDRLATRLEDAPDVATLQAGITRAAEFAAARGEAEAAERSALEEERAARKTLEGLQGEEQRARSQYGSARDGLAVLSPPEPGGSLIEDWEALAAWAAEKAATLTTAKAAAEERERAADVRQHEAVEQARSVCAPHFEPGDDPDGFAAGMAGALVRAENTHDRAVRERAARAELEERVDALRAKATVAAELGRLLRADGFERWLMQEAVDNLVERANERLLELSNGQYSFVADGTSFDICDHHNADEVRSAKTLSGGETFLASLALALALSDSQAELATEGSPGLDSLFLDEGFGTLDPDTLDVVAGAIEELGASGRMVCIVTHIRELAERMPVRFEVSKGPATSSVERVEA